MFPPYTKNSEVRYLQHLPLQGAARNNPLPQRKGFNKQENSIEKKLVKFLKLTVSSISSCPLYIQESHHELSTSLVFCIAQEQLRIFDRKSFQILEMECPPISPLEEEEVKKLTVLSWILDYLMVENQIFHFLGH